MATGRMTFYRTWSWQDAVRPYRIEVDGAKVGVLRPGGSLTLDVETGEHSVRARISWTGSPQLTLQVRAQEQRWVRVMPAQGASIGRMLGRHRWLTLIAE